MTNLIEKLEDSVATTLEGSATNSDIIYTTVEGFSNVPPYSGNITEEEKQLICKKLETRFDISMGIGSLLEADDYIPWLDHARGDIGWYYWKLYKRLLTTEHKFSPNVVSSLDMVTDKILDHLENPKKEGNWSRKGLVVGHVQSGKTANYTGLITKAADAGYKVIIVLAGLLNALRNQTQERIDEGFVGRDSSRLLEDINFKDKTIGVGKYDSTRSPITLTTNTHDFNKTIANQLGTQLNNFKEPIVFVLKKNVSILRNLIDWLKSNNLDLSQVPILLIDDEADHASVNTNKPDEDPTTTNKRIRELLSLFNQNCYLGYTATPFANIFINPETEDEMLNNDLFPEDFILSLDAPSNYIGAKRIFEDNSDLDILREIDDYEDILHVKHKIADLPEILIPSLKEAIRSFIIVKACRILRGQQSSHNSMLINVSRFTGIQSQIKLLIHRYLTELRESIVNHYALPEAQAIHNPHLAKIKETWEKEFAGTEFSWSQIQLELKKSISVIGVIEVNGSRNSEPLDYNRKDYPNGRNLIAIGGLSLSRGLTLEGLTISYFLRSSIMYDTLMQMGRWFGYRTNFEDLCRIYMTEDAISWYAHISRATEELRDEFKSMEKALMTPRDFGLCVRSHPESLIVTARNKMRSGQNVIRQISLEGRLIETVALIKSQNVVSNNHITLRKLLEKISDLSITAITNNQPGFLLKDIPVQIIETFLTDFINHPASQKTDRKPLIDYLQILERSGIDSWDVILISVSGVDNITINKLPSGADKVVCQKRTISSNGQPSNGIKFNNHRVASRGAEKAGLTIEEINSIEHAYSTNFPETKNLPDKIYRSARNKPLLMIHILDCRFKDTPDVPIFNEGIVAYGISFPGETGNRNPEKLVEYVVNTTWWKENYADILEEEDDYDE